MNKFIAPVLVVLIIVSAMYYTLYEDEKAVKNMKIEIENAHISKIRPEYVVLSLNTTFINDAGRKINKMEGNFTIFVLNQSIGNFSFRNVSIPAHSNKSINIAINIYYRDVVSAVISSLKEGKATIYMKGYIETKVLFGLFIYRQYVVIKQQENI